MVEIKKLQEWFQEKDYETGLILLAKYSKNRILLQNLHRKRYPAKLEYELLKFVKTLKVDTIREIKKKVPVEISKIEKIPDTGKVKIVAINREVKYDELPAKLQGLWHQNRDAYKEIRSLHEKLKLMEKASSETRQPLTVRIAELDDQIRKNWKIIDEWSPGQSPEMPVVTEINYKRINANRKYISTNLKKLSNPVNEKAYREILRKIQVRVDEILLAGEEISEKRAKELRKLGVKL